MHMSQSLLSTITDLALNKTDTGKKGQRATTSSRISGVVHDDRRHEWVVPQLRRYASATPQRLRYFNSLWRVSRMDAPISHVGISVR
jgi:hypothetical protein